MACAASPSGQDKKLYLFMRNNQISGPTCPCTQRRFICSLSYYAFYQVITTLSHDGAATTEIADMRCCNGNFRRKRKFFLLTGQQNVSLQLARGCAWLVFGMYCSKYYLVDIYIWTLIQLKNHTVEKESPTENTHVIMCLIWKQQNKS